MRPAVENISQLAISFLYVVAVSMISGGTLQVGVLVAFIMYIHRFWTPINNIAMFYNSLVTNMSYLELIFETLDEPVLVKDKPNATEMKKISGCVEFKNVNFSYEAEQKVLDDVSFSCEAGSTVALVGPTGAGKTTIVNLLSRFAQARFEVTYSKLGQDRFHAVDRGGSLFEKRFTFAMWTLGILVRYGRNHGHTAVAAFTAQPAEKASS